MGLRFLHGAHRIFDVDECLLVACVVAELLRIVPPAVIVESVNRPRICWIEPFRSSVPPGFTIRNWPGKSVFMPLESFSGVLRTLVEWNPVSTLTQACRELFGNYDPSVPVGDAWSMQHPALYTLIWVAIILVVFVPLSVRQYRLSAAR